MAARGRRQWQPDENARVLARTLAASGVDMQRIAAAIGISVPTLRRHLRDEIDAAAEKANAAVSASMFAMATQGPPSVVRYNAARYWLSCRANWREVISHEIIRPVSEMDSEEIARRLELDDRQREQYGLPPLDSSVVPFPAGPRR